MEHYIPVNLAHLSPEDIAKIHAYTDKAISEKTNVMFNALLFIASDAELTISEAKEIARNVTTGVV